MKKISQLLLFLSFSLLNCQSENHYHDGNYYTDIDVMGFQFAQIDYLIKGNEITIDNSISGISKVECKQYVDRIEFTDQDGIVRVLPVQADGNIKFTENIILKKVE